MGLKARLALLIALSIVGALLAQGFLGYLNFRQTARETVRADLQSYLATLAHDRAEGYAPSYLPNENGIRARLTKNGQVIEEYGGPFPKTLNTDGDDQWLVQKIAVPDLGTGAVLQASIPLRAYNQGLEAYLRTVLLSMGIMSLVGVGVALLVSRDVLRPLGDLLGAAERVAQSGQLDGRVAEPRDSGEIARLARMFNAMLERLSAFRQRETEFVRHAAHELRTPLAALRAQVDANHQHWISDQELIQTVDEQVDRLTTLTEALLLLSRENATVREDIDLAALARQMAVEYGAVYIGPESVQFSGSTALLTQALTNLLENARKYAPGAGVVLRLSLTVNTVTIGVEDDGVGVDDTRHSRLTEAFYRVPGTRAAGSGLGLAVVKRVAEAHDGSVQIAANQPQGLLVSVCLPLPSR